jgi:hypothetical protein
MRTLILLASAVALAACAPTSGRVSPSDPEQCFLASQLTNFRTDDSRAVYVRASRGSVFELRATGVCLDVDWARTLAVTPFGGGSRLCAGDQATLRYTGLSGDRAPGRCRVTVERRLSEAEVAALPGRLRP